ncbi:TetR/AcrR family transcriptional regulator [Solirubrobacter soli]|uniref:TetR/AcrR family transcriptional regulator n=1 Tax=Solirubrobacter soli TaxID=363832 RepID=UPI00042920CA|nr:TetR/AcrR family transcriptional regulator [Solirubrobacter soli]
MPVKRPALNREKVLQAGLKLADAHGVEELSMRKLAKALGVEAMSLYNHVANKDDLIDGLIDLVFDEIEAPQPGVEWRTALRLRATTTREALRRHPWANGQMEGRARPGPSSARLHEAVLRCLREAGFSVSDTARAYSIQDSFIYGFALQEQSLPAFDDAAISAEVADRVMRLVDPDVLPYTAEMVDIHVRAGGYNLTAEFEFGLELILDGLERLRATG